MQFHKVCRSLSKKWTSTTRCLLDAALLLNPYKQTECNDLIGLHGLPVTVTVIDRDSFVTAVPRN